MSVDTATLIDNVPKPVLALCRTFAGAGFRAWIVGGCVRDLLRAQLAGEPFASRTDWDLATDARPEQVKQLFRRVIPTGIEHGTVTVMLDGEGYEVTTLRGETTYSDGRHPDAVFFVDDITADLARRDFTVNAIALDPLTGALSDPFDGFADLQRGLLRAVREPTERFAEDGLRVLRGARFTASLGMELEPTTAAAIRPSLDSYRRVSVERVLEEWRKALKATQPSRAFRVMREHGLLEFSAPELAELGERRTPAHAQDSLTLGLLAVDRSTERTLLRLATLAMELGRAADGSRDAQLGATLTDGVLLRLKASTAERQRVAALVRAWDFDTSATDGPRLRRWLRAVGVELVPGLVDVRRSRHLALGELAELSALDDFTRAVDATLAARPALSTKELALDGRALMSELGLAPGKHVGQLLETLLELVLDEPSRNERATLLAAARERLPAS